ncbi:hypothetical protein J1N09_01645 [Aureitalea sp. L0-47]|uniref:hypothetical protein n=1 Tax=Aureitalea sp. L0-47 TaxID=2816962 RepID=UPI002238FFE7|nr:hypothetical protein [Aureitalea sp. L0-47]MCW5518524.1 hypothetical protein [Aureitalea sp. L0-47]
MKNLIMKACFLFVLVLLGCSKDEFHDPVGEVADNTYYIMDQEDGTYSGIKISSTSDNNAFTIPEPTIDRLSFKGAYLYDGRLLINLNWNALCDETGMCGGAEIKQTTATYGYHFVMCPAAMVAEDNNAIFEGTIVEVISKWGDVPNFDVNWRFCFNVIDNANGTGFEHDKISKTMMFGSPMSPLMSSMYPPGHNIWSSKGYNDVMPPGFVEVSHNPEIPVD